MTEQRPLSARAEELLEAAYGYALTHGLADLSLRPLAADIGTSPRVLLYLFGSKDGLVRALLARARTDELAILERLRRDSSAADLPAAVITVWQWLADPAHRDLLTLWLEGYGRSLTHPDGPWKHFAELTVTEWLATLAQFQPQTQRKSQAGTDRRTAALAILRGAMLDLLATGDLDRISSAVGKLAQTL